MRTADPGVLIEEQFEGYVRYRRSDGLRWEVWGVCDRNGACLVGAVIDGQKIETLKRAHELASAYEGPDVPVAPGFKGCCPLEVRVL